MDRDIGEFSGGWMMRVALGRLLLANPDLLLLDEPTNHLDLASVEWLQGFLGEYAGAVVLVSHDRDFINAVVNRVAELNHGMFTEYVGVDMLRIDPQTPPDQATETSGIQRGARPDDTAGRNAHFPGIARRDMSHHVDRVRCNEQNRFRGMLKNTGNDLFEYLCVPPEELKPRLTGFLSHSSRDDNNFAARQVGILSRSHLQWVRKRDRMENIIRFSLGPRPILIDKDQPPSCSKRCWSRPYSSMSSASSSSASGSPLASVISVSI